MRKDAKIGFAIGGVLLAVLTVYAIVVPKHKKANSTVSIVTPVPPVDNTAPAQPPGLSASDNSANAATPVTPVVTTPPPATPAVASRIDSAVANNTDNSTPAAPLDVSKPADVKPDKPVDPSNNGMIVVDPPADTHVKPVKPVQSHEDNADAVGTGKDRTYVIQSGQTLSSIAAEVYGNSRFWVAIQRENKSINANRLKVGEKINLPDIAPIQPSLEETAGDVEVPKSYLKNAVATVSNTVIPSAGSSVPATTDAHSYVVKSGDSLYKIARTVLGSGRKADALYALNKDVIGPDRAKLKLGMVLKLPQGATSGLAMSDMGR